MSARNFHNRPQPSAFEPEERLDTLTLSQLLPRFVNVHECRQEVCRLTKQPAQRRQKTRRVR